MKVKEIMSTHPVKTCNPETVLSNATLLMKESNRGALPVIDKEQKVVGIITDRDVCLALSENPGKTPSSILVRDVMKTPKIHTIQPETSVVDALKEMRKFKIGRLPVTGKDGTLKGMISVNTILSNALDENKHLEAVGNKEENLAKTIKALFERNNKTHAEKKEKKKHEFEVV
jgi:CBS domain-containing protein